MHRKEFLKQSFAGSAFIPFAGVLTGQHTPNKGSSLLLNELEPIDITGEINDNRTVTGTVLNIGELVYENGLGTSVPAQVTYKIPDGYKRLEGYPVYDKRKFPHGMKKLGEFIHNKGLKFGIYSRPDWVGGDHSFDGLWTGGNETKHAKTFAEWGVDYLKYDFGEKGAFWFMGQALKQVNRDIIYSVCGWGKEQEWQWAPSFGGNLWRTTYDVMAIWETGSDQNPVGIMDAVDQTEVLGRFAGPGQWNDPDMLVIGLKGGTAVQDMHQNEISRLNKYEQRSQMSLYALLSAPLIIGGDIRHMDQTAIETLLNKEVIAIDQDLLAVPAWRVLKLDKREVWKKPLEYGGYAIGLLNRGESPATIAASWRQLNLEGKYQVRDLWKHREMGVESGEISRSVKPHQTILLRLSPIK